MAHANKTTRRPQPPATIRRKGKSKTRWPVRFADFFAKSIATPCRSARAPSSNYRNKSCVASWKVWRNRRTARVRNRRKRRWLRNYARRISLWVEAATRISEMQIRNFFPARFSQTKIPQLRRKCAPAVEKHLQNARQNYTAVSSDGDYFLKK